MPLAVLRPQTYPARLVGTRPLARETHEYVFALDAGARMPMTPGQFVMLLAPQPDGRTEKRPYSIVNAPRPGEDGVDRIVLCVKHLDGGAATTFLQGLAVGDPAQLEGPFGRFTLRESSPGTRRVLIATGTGIAPFMSMLPSAPDALLLAGYRNEGDIIYGPELAALPGMDARISLSAPGEGWAGLHGRVTAHLPAIAAAEPGAQFYMCGNPQMVEEARNILLAAGIPAPQIIQEKFTTIGKQRAARA